MNKIECRSNCAACCIVISISSPLPGMPNGKPAGVRCVNLTKDNACSIFGSPERPDVCYKFTAEREFCGYTTEDAFQILDKLENSK